MGFLPFVFPFAELEVGQHLYWQIGNFRIHGQVFMTSWLLIGALLALVVIGTKKMERDPKGLQNQDLKIIDFAFFVWFFRSKFQTKF